GRSMPIPSVKPFAEATDPKQAGPDEPGAAVSLPPLVVDRDGAPPAGHPVPSRLWTMSKAVVRLAVAVLLVVAGAVGGLYFEPRSLTDLVARLDRGPEASLRSHRPPVAVGGPRPWPSRPGGLCPHRRAAVRCRRCADCRAPREGRRYGAPRRRPGRARQPGLAGGGRRDGAGRGRAAHGRAGPDAALGPREPRRIPRSARPGQRPRRECRARVRAGEGTPRPRSHYP